MSREALQESLSAVMDNEADELELRRVLNACDDVETRETWARYQIARAVMHKDLLLPRLDIAAAVSAALEDETAPAKVSRSPWRNLGRLAVAASVTVAVLAIRNSNGLIIAARMPNTSLPVAAHCSPPSSYTAK